MPQFGPFDYTPTQIEALPASHRQRCGGEAGGGVASAMYRRRQGDFLQRHSHRDHVARVLRRLYLRARTHSRSSLRDRA